MRMSDADREDSFINHSGLMVPAFIGRVAVCCTRQHLNLIPRFFAQVELLWNKMKIYCHDFGLPAVAELNRTLRYSFSFSVILEP